MSTSRFGQSVPQKNGFKADIDFDIIKINSLF